MTKYIKVKFRKSGTAILPSKRVRRIPEKITTTLEAENKTEEKIKEDNQHAENEAKTAEYKTEEKIKEDNQHAENEAKTAENKTEEKIKEDNQHAENEAKTAENKTEE